ncbi:MAG: hypothetical protein KAT28_01005 [Candidatus Aenigmarchaeota archaeon]|nr:hypothetical protein [Candidatus Aenigmarchaeota archaeon]
MIGDKRYEELREELEDIVDQIKIGDGILVEHLEQIADRQYTGNEYHPIFGKFRGELDFYEFSLHVFDKQVNQVEAVLDKAELKPVEIMYLNEKIVEYRKIIQDKIYKD